MKNSKPSAGYIELDKLSTKFKHKYWLFIINCFCRPTTVHRFIVRNTIEENIYNAVTKDKNKRLNCKSDNLTINSIKQLFDLNNEEHQLDALINDEISVDIEMENNT